LQNTATEFLQKSHIAALDLTYDLTANWSWAASTRTGWERQAWTACSRLSSTIPRSSPCCAWTGGSQAWDTLAEVRQLGLPDINQRRRGVLTAIYHHISKNLRLASATIFTDFSDELTDLKYNHRGIFVNLIGTSDGDRACAWYFDKDEIEGLRTHILRRVIFERRVS